MENNKVSVRATNTFKYTPFPNGIPRDIFPGEYFLLNLNLEQDRLELANILHPSYKYKGFVFIASTELDKIEALGYRKEIDKLIKNIKPEVDDTTKEFGVDNIYNPPGFLSIPEVGSPELPRLEYVGVTKDLEIKEVKEKVTKVKPVEVVKEETVEVPTEESVVSETSNNSLKLELEAVHYKRLQKIATDQELVYETKDQFINLLLDLPKEQFDAIYSEYISNS